MLKRIRLALEALKGEDRGLIEQLEDQVEARDRLINKLTSDMEWFALRAGPEYELGAIGTPRERFLNGLADLTRQTGVSICSGFLDTKSDTSHPGSGYIDDNDFTGWFAPDELAVQEDLLPIYRGKQYGPKHQTSEKQGQAPKGARRHGARCPDSAGQPQQGAW